MKQWYWLVLLLFVAGCAETHSGGVDKRYDVTIRVTGDHNSFSMGVEADTSAESSAGDADATIDPRVSGSLYGPANTEGIMKDLSYIIEKWNKIDSENETTTNETNVPPSGGDSDAGTVPDSGGSDTDGSGDDGSVDGMVISGWDVLNQFPCDQTMTFHDDTETEGVEQDKCLFTDYLSCEELPDSFMVVWKGGDRIEQLQVPDKCTMAWVTADKDYRKYRPIDDKEPHPVAYAPRGMEADDVYIFVKKQ